LSADPLGELAAVHVGKHDVGEDELVEARVLEKHPERLLPVSGDSGVISERANQPAGRGARGRAALDDENDWRTKQREREWVGREHGRLQDRGIAARNPLHDEGVVELSVTPITERPDGDSARVVRSASVGRGGGVAHPGESCRPAIGSRRRAAELEVIFAQQPSAGDSPRVGGVAVQEGDDAIDEDLDRSPGARIYSRIQVREIGSELGLPSPRLGGLGLS
jgi:hypothetical protein